MRGLIMTLGRTLRASITACLMIFLLGLALTALGVHRTRAAADQQARLNFERHVDKLDADIGARFARVLARLKGVRSYYAASPVPVTRDAFRIWVAARGTDDNLHGVRGVGFIAHVERADLDSFLSAERADGAPGFTVHTSGTANDLYVIKYIEPLANNEKAWGLDLGFEQHRRVAVERAVDTGKPALSERITLVQDGKSRPGYLYCVPVFKWASKFDTPEDRRHNLIGLLYSPIVFEEFMSHVADVSDSLLDLDVYDGDGTAADQKIFDLGLASVSNGHDAQAFHSAWTSSKTLVVGGNKLTFVVSSTPEFERRYADGSTLWLGVSGVVLSGLLSVTIWLLLIGRARAEAIALRMTADLSAAKQGAERALRDKTAVLDTLHRYKLMSVADKSGKIIDANEAFCRISGYGREELIGQPHSIVNSGMHPSAFWIEMWQTISNGQAWEGDVCNRAKSGDPSSA